MKVQWYTMRFCSTILDSGDMLEYMAETLHKTIEPIMEIEDVLYDGESQEV